MKKRVVLFLFCILASMLALVAFEPREALSFTNSRTYAASDFDPPLSLSGEGALLQLLGLSLDDLDIWRDHESPNGFRSRKFHQRVEGQRLYGASLLLITDKDGQFIKLKTRSPGNTGEFEIIQAKLSDKEAISAAIRGVYDWRIKESSFVIAPKSETVIYQSAPLYRLIFDSQGQPSNSLRYAYVVSLNGSPDGEVVPQAIKGDMIDVLVDGKTGNVLDVVNRVAN